MDNFNAIYRILCYLEEAMDYDKPDMARISPETLNISQQRWAAVMEVLASEGYVTGTPLRITLKGLEYLAENSPM